MRTPSALTKSERPLKPLITATVELWRSYHLSYDQACYITKEVRKLLDVQRGTVDKRVIHPLSQDEEQRLIQAAYHHQSERGLLLKTLFQTGARVSEFARIRVEDFFPDKAMILLATGQGGKQRYVPILPELAHELQTYLGKRTTGYLFETKQQGAYSPRRLQQIVKETAATAKIHKRVYPHLLRHSVATTLLERGMPIEQIQKFLGHTRLETMQVHVEVTPAMIHDSYRRALSTNGHQGPSPH